jgi:hypothetical protein
VKTPAATEITTSACQNSSVKFTGTDNPRHLRVLAVLMRRPVPRHELDNIAGCSNGPELVAELRRRGLPIDCERVEAIDRDGRPCRPGVYSLPSKGRRLFWAWKAAVAQQRGQA